MGKRWAGLMVLVVAISLAACGGDNGAATSTPSATSTQVAMSTPGTGSTPVAANGTPTVTPLKAAAGELTVYAAASLNDAFTKIGRDFAASTGGMASQFNFAGSQDLVTQLSNGAQADVFASADQKNMDAAVKAGVIDGTPSKLLTNKLVVILPETNPGNIQSLKDLANAGVKIDLADVSVPAGNYAQQVLDKLSADATYGSDFKSKVNANVISKENNVKAVVSKVQLGEADAGIVYITDATATQASPLGSTVGQVKTIAIPDQYNVIAVYYIAKVKGAMNSAAADSFITYVTTGAGAATLQQLGFGPANP